MHRLLLVLAVAALAAGCGRAEQAAAPEVALLTGVHAGGDSVRFEFRSAPDDVKTRIVAPVRLAESGSGRHVAIAGVSVLVVSFTPAATADIQGEQAVPTYTGPRRLRPEAAGPVRELVKVGDFEAQLEWAIGLDRRLPAHVSRDGATVTVSFG